MVYTVCTLKMILLAMTFALVVDVAIAATSRSKNNIASMGYNMYDANFDMAEDKRFTNWPKDRLIGDCYKGKPLEFVHVGKTLTIL